MDRPGESLEVRWSPSVRRWQSGVLLLSTYLVGTVGEFRLVLGWAGVSDHPMVREHLDFLARGCCCPPVLWADIGEEVGDFETVGWRGGEHVPLKY